MWGIKGIMAGRDIRKGGVWKRVPAWSLKVNMVGRDVERKREGGGRVVQPSRRVWEERLALGLETSIENVRDGLKRSTEERSEGGLGMKGLKSGCR